MKSKRINRLIAGALGLGMILGLCACGGDGNGNNGQTAQIEQYAGKEFVYAPSFVDLSESGYIDNLVVSNDRAYFFSSSYGNSDLVQKLKYIELNDSSLNPKDTEFVIYNSMEQGTAEYCLAMNAMSNGNIIVTLCETSDLETVDKDYIVILDENGVEQSRYDITDDITVEDVEYSYPYTLLADKEDNIIVSDNENFIWKFDSEGNLIKRTPLNAGWVNNFNLSGDGELLFSGWGDGDVYTVSSVDLETGEVKKKVTCDDDNFYSIDSLFTGDNGETYAVTSDSLFLLDLEKDTYEEVIRWRDSDIVGSDLTTVFSLGDDEFGTILSESIDDEKALNEFVILRKTPVSEMPVKEIVTLGVINSGFSSDKLIAKYNRKSTDYRIEVKDYYTEAEGDYQKAVENFNNDVLSGSAPDVIDIRNVNALMFTSKDLFVDLGKMMDDDPDIDRGDYFESVLATCTTADGLLYAIPSTFSLISLAGRTEDVGTNAPWSISEMRQVIESHPDLKIIDYMDKESALAMLLYTNYSKYIDWAAGKCNFDSDEFVELLNVVNLFPKEIPESEYANYDNIGGIKNHTSLLTEADISSFSDIQLIKKEFNEDEITYIGLPDIGTAVVSGDGYAINAKTSNLEGAWDFVRSNIIRDSYLGDKWEFPTQKEAFKLSADNAMKKVMVKDENGEEKEICTMTIGYDNYSFEIYAMTDDEYDTLLDLIKNAKGSVNYDKDIYAIIEEEANAFFGGGKTAEEAASIIQSRIQMYVDETR